MRQLIAGFIFLFFMTGCTKDFNLDPDQVKELYVIDGRISNLEGPYFVRVTKTMANFLPADWANGAVSDTADAVTNALVIIYDDNGVIDTLIPATNKFEGMIYSYFPNMVFDSNYVTRIERYNTRERGFYQTTKLQGAPGHTYSLRVEVDGQVFQASAFMPPVATLKHAAYRDTAISPWTNVGPIPVAYFRDPPGEKNYYMLKKVPVQKYPYDYADNIGATVQGGAPNYIDYYFFDDKLLVPGLNAIPTQYMFNYAGRDSYPFAYDGDMKHVRLCSLTKETYDYIKVFSKQLISDGNIYKPAPASPKGNISGGALGLFFASHISAKLLYPK